MCEYILRPTSSGVIRGGRHKPLVPRVQATSSQISFFLREISKSYKCCVIEVLKSDGKISVIDGWLYLFNKSIVISCKKAINFNYTFFVTIENRIYREELTRKKCKTAILLYCFHTAGVLHIFMLYNLLLKENQIMK